MRSNAMRAGLEALDNCGMKDSPQYRGTLSSDGTINAKMM
jgi:hypothetical protein